MKIVRREPAMREEELAGALASARRGFEPLRKPHHNIGRKKRFTHDELMTFLRQGLSVKEIREQTGAGVNTIRRGLKELEEKGVISLPKKEKPVRSTNGSTNGRKAEKAEPQYSLGHYDQILDMRFEGLSADTLIRSANNLIGRTQRDKKGAEAKRAYMDVEVKYERAAELLLSDGEFERARRIYHTAAVVAQRISRLFLVDHESQSALEWRERAQYLIRRSQTNFKHLPST